MSDRATRLAAAEPGEPTALAAAEAGVGEGHPMVTAKAEAIRQVTAKAGASRR